MQPARMKPLGDLYRQIGDDYSKACVQHDAFKQRDLLGLVVALEKAYPKEMAALREEGLELPV